MNKIELNYDTIINDIIGGVYGNSGDLFLSIRDFCKKHQVTYYSAYTLYHKLEQEHLIVSIRKKWYLTYGIAADNSAIKSLSNKNLIGLHVKEIDNAYITSIISSLKAVLEQYGFMLIIQTSENNSNSEMQVLNNFVSLGCSGVINFPTTETIILNYYKNYPLPMVFIGRKINIEKKYNLPSVLTDNYQTGKVIARTLLEKGYKSFYFITHKSFSSNINKRLLGFRALLNDENNDLLPDKNILETDYSDTATIRNFCINIMRNASDNNPVAIFCINDLFAAKILTTLISLKADIPNSIGIVGYDDLPVCQYTSPTITSVSYSLKEMAAQAVKLLFSVSADTPQFNKAIYIPNYVIQRKSTARNVNQSAQ